MKKSKKPAIAFIAVELAIYIAYLAADLGFVAANSIRLKFISICLCLVFSAIFTAMGGEKLITAAMVFTLAADNLLLMANSDYALGVAFFCVVQAIYFYMLYRENGKTLLPLRIILFALALILLWKMNMLSGLNVLAAFYFTSFVCNVIQSFGTGRRLFSLGLVLFLCCDVCVGIFNLPQLAGTGIYSFAAFGMWLFYLPAQVLIVLSGRRCEA